MIRINRLVIFSMALLVFVFVYTANELFRSHAPGKKEYQYLSLFSEVVALVKADYVEKITPAEKFPGAYSAMLASLDKYSAYLSPGETQMYDRYCNGQTCGTGIYGIRSSGYFYVTDVVEDSPAARAGIESGDIIKAVNGKSIFGKSHWEMVIALLTNLPGKVEVMVFKNGSGDPARVTLETSPGLFLPPVMTPVENQTGIYLVNLSRIDEPRVHELETRLKELTAGPRPIKLIIDLRRYSGGDISSFKRVAGLFFRGNDPLPLTIKTKEGEEQIEISTPPGQPFSYQAVVITSRSTILYGELLAYLFKTGFSIPGTTGDQIDKTAPTITLVGRKTPGFIPWLKSIHLQDGSSILLTHGFFYINGNKLDLTGVDPHVKLTKKEFSSVITRSISILNGTNEKNPTKI